MYTNRCETRDSRTTRGYPNLYTRPARISENLQLTLTHHNEGNFVSDNINPKHRLLNLIAAFRLRKFCMRETLLWEIEKTKYYRAPQHHTQFQFWVYSINNESEMNSIVYDVILWVLKEGTLSVSDCWLEVSIRKVLRPATSTQVFLGFPVPISKRSDGSQHSKLPLHASHVALRT